MEKERGNAVKSGQNGGLEGVASPIGRLLSARRPTWKTLYDPALIRHKGERPPGGTEKRRDRPYWKELVEAT